MKTKDNNRNNLTKEQLDAGLNQLKQWYPEEAEKIDLHRNTILANIIEGIEIPKNDPILEEEHSTTFEKYDDQNLLTISPCIKARAGFFVEGCIFVGTVAGCVSAARFRNLYERGMLALIGHGEEYSSEIQILWKVVEAAEGKLAKAKAFAPIATEFWNKGAIKVFIDIVKQNSTWKDYVLDGAVAVAQIIVWVASEFIAALAEFALVILAATHLFLTGKEMRKVCSG